MLRIPCYSVFSLAVLVLASVEAGAQRAHSVDVKAADYALILPDTIKAGSNRWTFTNTGLMRHEFIIAKLAPNVDPKVAVDSLHARGLRMFFPGDSLFGVANSGLFAAPGKRSAAEIVTQDRRGDVLLVFCQLRDAPDKPKHDEMGMFKVVRVR